jgi:hypothetical protein
LEKRETRADIELRFFVGAAIGEDGLCVRGAARSSGAVQDFVQFFMRVDAITPEAIKVYSPIDVVDTLQIVFDSGEEVFLGLREFEIGGKVARLDSRDSDEGKEASADSIKDFVESGLRLALGCVLVGVFVNSCTPDRVDATSSCESASSDVDCLLFTNGGGEFTKHVFFPSSVFKKKYGKHFFFLNYNFNF